jgi:methylated-DNA-[protein]-cysteine S-methyltransferase
MVFYYHETPFFIREIALPHWEKDAGPIRPAAERSFPADGLPGLPAGLRELDRTVLLLMDYFNGVPVAPPWRLLSMKGLSGLQQQVLRAVADIPFGALKTYGDIAEAVGRPGACRFVGNTMAKNPFPIFVPCHRVVRRNGGIGGFGGGPDLKTRLIAFENEKIRDL